MKTFKATDYVEEMNKNAFKNTLSVDEAECIKRISDLSVSFGRPQIHNINDVQSFLWLIANVNNSGSSQREVNEMLWILNRMLSNKKQSLSQEDDGTYILKSYKNVIRLVVSKDAIAVFDPKFSAFVEFEKTRFEPATLATLDRLVDQHLSQVVEQVAILS